MAEEKSAPKKEKTAKTASVAGESKPAKAPKAPKTAPAADGSSPSAGAPAAPAAPIEAKPVELIGGVARQDDCGVAEAGKQFKWKRNKQGSCASAITDIQGSTSSAG